MDATMLQLSAVAAAVDPQQARIRGREYWRRGLAVLVALMGLANISSSLIVRVADRERLLHAVLPLEVTHGSRSAAVVAGVILLLISRGLWRGKRWTWGVALAVLWSSAVFHLVKGLDWEEAGAAITIAGLLLWQRDVFRANADRPALRRALLAAACSALGLIAYVLIGGALLHNQFTTSGGSRALWHEVGARLLLGVDTLQPQTRRAAWFLDSISIVGVVLVVYTLGALLRSLTAPTASDDERTEAERLLRQYGTSSLAPFALSPDKSLFFGGLVDGLVAYRVASDVAVVLGDPIADPSDLGSLLREFAEYCTAHGWDVCLYEAQEVYLPVYAALGLHTLKIGEDAWIDLSRWTLKGKPIADIRHAVSKIERDGLQFHVWNGDIAAWEQMRSLAAAGDRGEWELQFSIGRLPALPDPNSRYTYTLSADGSTVLGFCSWLPIGGVNGWALDVLQRHPDAPSGTIEYVIAQALTAFQQDGAAWASLGVAPLADAAADNDEDRSLLQRGVRFLYEHPRINELYRYKSLFFFKRKFVPQWRGVYLVYGSRLDLPRLLYAVLNVHLPVLGPGLVIDWLRSQGGRNLQRWRDRIVR